LEGTRGRRWVARSVSLFSNSRGSNARHRRYRSSFASLTQNKDYTGGQLPALIDVIIAGKAKVFVCAVGVPPKWAVEKLHAANILVMNMIGAPKHIPKALAVGVDIICAQVGFGSDRSFSGFD
jgi:NAD(P)H-dependent flavin oxidoreductase YrpB (nitropropane dioxygenase family)